LDGPPSRLSRAHALCAARYSLRTTRAVQQRMNGGGSVGDVDAGTGFRSERRARGTGLVPNILQRENTSASGAVSRRPRVGAIARAIVASDPASRARPQICCLRGSASTQGAICRDLVHTRPAQQIRRQPAGGRRTLLRRRRHVADPRSVGAEFRHQAYRYGERRRSAAMLHDTGAGSWLLPRAATNPRPQTRMAGDPEGKAGHFMRSVGRGERI
jgi:hypothetical protein